MEMAVKGIASVAEDDEEENPIDGSGYNEEEQHSMIEGQMYE